MRELLDAKIRRQLREYGNFGYVGYVISEAVAYIELVEEAIQAEKERQTMVARKEVDVTDAELYVAIALRLKLLASEPGWSGDQAWAMAKATEGLIAMFTKEGTDAVPFTRAIQRMKILAVAASSIVDVMERLVKEAESDEDDATGDEGDCGGEEPGSGNGGP